MADANLNGLKVAILVTDGFEQVEMTEPRKALDQAGAETRLVSPKDGQVKAWKFTEWGDTLPVDVPLDKADASKFDALLLPGGVLNPDALRIQPKAVAFVKAFFDANNQWRWSATVRGRLSKQVSREAGESLRGLPSRRTSGTPAPSGSISRLWSMAISFRAESPMTFQLSTQR